MVAIFAFKYLSVILELFVISATHGNQRPSSKPVLFINRPVASVTLQPPDRQVHFSGGLEGTPEHSSPEQTCRRIAAAATDRRGQVPGAGHRVRAAQEPRGTRRVSKPGPGAEPRGLQVVERAAVGRSEQAGVQRVSPDPFSPLL